MKIGVLQFFSWPERRVALAQVYERALQRIGIMDRSGYDAVWLAEHHFSSFSVCPSVHMIGVLAAARTTRLRIGTGVSLAPFYHPLRLAEEVALLDVLSGGRVNWGAGRGFSRVEFDNFGVPPEESAERFREAVEIVLRAWTEDRLVYAGNHFRFDGVEVLPKPMQRPHPPVWLAATSDPAIEWAAESGFSILLDPHASHRDIGRKRRLYAERLAAAGHSIAGRELPMARLIALGNTAADAKAVARNGAQWMVKSYIGGEHRPVGQGTGRITPSVADPVQRYLDEVILHGTPEAVLDHILQLREEIGLEYLLCASLSHETFLLLTEQILPRLPVNRQEAPCVYRCGEYLSIQKFSLRQDMPLNIKDPATEKSVRELAAATGESVTTAVRRAAEERLDRVRRNRISGSLAAELLEIGRRCAALPELDGRSADEILGYDERGVSS
jgi:alkanesulfonate monooxygenase SsuD/methylene tetrahydromethanopterin reductase-like flavin-dependent oxidoreductase (luciferase family)